MTEGPRACPWCSATVPAAATECPACGAALPAGQEPDLQLPGLTTVATPDRPRRRARRGFLGLLLGGSEPAEDDPAPR